MITILTPTYNRMHTLPRLYESLVSQTCYEFEWLVIDDGSNDDTEILIKTYQEVSPFNIRYLRKMNGGKHTALNFGFREASHDWVFIVDSDDYLKQNTVEVLVNEISTVSDCFNSISILKVYEDGSIIGNKFPSNISSYIEKAYSNVSGDKADLIRLNALEGFSFPEYPNENFMAESPLFIWLGKKGKTRFVNFEGYICEYLKGGLSDSSVANRHRCFRSTLYVYALQYNSFDKNKLKFRAAINWWRFRLFKKMLGNIYSVPIFYAIPGFLLYFLDRVKGKVKPL